MDESIEKGEREEERGEIDYESDAMMRGSQDSWGSTRIRRKKGGDEVVRCQERVHLKTTYLGKCLPITIQLLSLFLPSSIHQRLLKLSKMILDCTAAA